LGIKSRGKGNWAQKKGAPTARPSKPALGINLARGWSLDQIPQPRKGLNSPVNRHFVPFSSEVDPGSREENASKQRVIRFELNKREGWRPGLDLNQDKERCTALASTLSATGPTGSSPIMPL